MRRPNPEKPWRAADNLPVISPTTTRTTLTTLTTLTTMRTSTSLMLDPAAGTVGAASLGVMCASPF